MEERIIQFINALRNKGVRVSLAESADAFNAVDNLGAKQRENFRLSLRATLIKDFNDLPIFDELFPLFFDTGGAPPMMSLPDDLTPEEAAMLAEALQAFNRKLRQLLEKLLRGEELTPEELERLEALTGLNYADDPRYMEWMRRRMEQALRFPEIQEALRDMMAILQEMGMKPERLQQMGEIMQQNMQAMREQIRRQVGQRIAENMSERDPERGVDALYDRPFHSLTDSEMDQLRKEVTRLAAIIRTRVALRQKRAKTGTLDAKATIRANLKHHGVPFDIKHRDRRLKPKIVVICDISTSMRHMSELMLSLLYAMQDQITKTHAFAFIDHMEYISPDFQGCESREAVNRVLVRLPPGYYSTDLGHSLTNFAKDYLDTLDSRTTLIMVGDGRNNYNNPRTDIFGQMARRANRTIWLNPEHPYQWGSGDSDMLDYHPLCDKVLRVSTLAELSAAIDSLLVG
ncbi:MAG TPA: VWA domain-containing protein [Anaerolineales bacterium]|nr:VWA domain-containing protein [Anaerolineales bacterium]